MSGLSSAGLALLGMKSIETDDTKLKKEIRRTRRYVNAVRRELLWHERHLRALEALQQVMHP